MATQNFAKLFTSFPRVQASQILRKGFLNNLNIKHYSAASAVKTDFEFIKTHKAGAKSSVGVITLNRPKALNALSNGVIQEVAKALDTFEQDNSVGAIVITGNEKVFCAGADVREMLTHTYSSLVTAERNMKHWNRISESVKPTIAAVNGYAFTAGCELAMMCDIVYAGENAIFGQLEVLNGTIPGAGGSQRLPRAVGKSKAMEMVLTGEQVTAHQAEKMGLVSKVFPVDKLVDEAVKLGEKISKNSHLINQLCKESVNAAFETTLQQGLRYEKKLFHGTFATKDRKEGMTAFIEKRPPNFTNE